MYTFQRCRELKYMIVVIKYRIKVCHKYNGINIKPALKLPIESNKYSEDNFKWNKKNVWIMG